MRTPSLLTADLPYADIGMPAYKHIQPKNIYYP